MKFSKNNFLDKRQSPLHKFRAKMVNEDKETDKEEDKESKEKWDVRFNIGDVWEKVDYLDTDIPDEMDQFKAFIMPKLRRFRNKMKKYLKDDEAISELEKIMDELDDALDSIEWDIAWAEFYEWAEDYNVLIKAEENFINDFDDEIDDEIDEIENYF